MTMDSATSSEQSDANAATPRYVVQKVGDRYVPVLQQPTDAGSDSVLWRWGGGGLMLYGFMCGGPRGGLCFIFWGSVIFCGVTGRSVASLFATGPRRARDGQPKQAPSYQNDFRDRAPQMPADDVDEASMESFPASDPPTRSTTARM